MTAEDYNRLVQECNQAIFMNKSRFEFGGREYSTEFKYILAMIGGKYGYDSRINDKYVIIKNQA
jgi:hypothetical protein